MCDASIPSTRLWRVIAEEASREYDAGKMAELAASGILIPGALRSLPACRILASAYRTPPVRGQD